MQNDFAFFRCDASTGTTQTISLVARKFIPLLLTILENVNTNNPNPRYMFPGGHSMKTSQNTHEKINGHCELTVITAFTAPGPNDHGSVTARLGHSSVTARSQLSHG